MSGLDFDEIRKEIAIRHNVLIGKEDPILVTVTVNEIILGHYVKLLSDKFDEVNRGLTISLEQQVEQAKGTAGKIITEASGYVSKEIKTAGERAISEISSELRRQIADAKETSRDADRVGREAHTAKHGAYIAAMVSGVSAFIALAALAISILK